jgi:hypothetical protein
MGSLERVWAIAAKDAAQELRRRVAAASIFFFAATAVTLVSFAVGPFGLPAEARDRVCGALLWIILFFSAATGLPRAFVREEETGTAHALRKVAPASLTLAGKTLFNYFLFLALAAVTVPALRSCSVARRIGGRAGRGPQLSPATARRRRDIPLAALLSLPEPTFSSSWCLSSLPAHSFGDRGDGRSAGGLPYMGLPGHRRLRRRGNLRRPTCGLRGVGRLIKIHSKRMKSEVPPPPMAAIIVGAFLWPAAQGFIGESSRIVFFHVPCAWTSALAFLVAAGFSAAYLASQPAATTSRRRRSTWASSSQSSPC